MKKKTDDEEKQKFAEDMLELLAWLKSINSEYLSKEGLSFLDGLIVSGMKPEFVSIQEYDKIKQELEQAKKSSKKWWNKL